MSGERLPPGQYQPSVALTGATGYIGRRVVAVLAHHNVQPVILGRRPSGKFEWRRFDISDPATHVCPAGVTALIHLAANTSNVASSVAADEVEACRRLAKSAREAGARFVFVSSQTARPDAPTSYGLTKWECERAVLALGGVVVRVGLVYGSAGAGLFGQLMGLVRALPIYPILLPAPLVQPVHVDDLARWLVEQSLCAQPETCSQAGAWPPVPFHAFLSAIAKHRLRSWRLGVPFPMMAVRALTTALRVVGVRLAPAERLISLAELHEMDSRAWVKDFAPRSLEDGMHRPGTARRRSLLLQARPVFLAVCGSYFSRYSLRQYARLLDTEHDKSSDLTEQERKRLAMALAEATLGGARRTLMEGRTHGWGHLTFALTRAVGKELKQRVLRLFPGSAR